MIDNYNLCHMRTINWDEIITGPGAKWMYMYNFSNSERECPPCDKSCTGGCWGEGPHNCQKFSKINCSPQCYQGRCFGPKPRDCCHLFCAGGCTGPKQSDCLVRILQYMFIITLKLSLKLKKKNNFIYNFKGMSKFLRRRCMHSRMSGDATV